MSIRNHFFRRLAAQGAEVLQSWAVNAQHSGRRSSTGEEAYIQKLPRLAEVIDVGASRGQWGMLIARHHPGATYLGIEPAKELAAEARAKLPDDWVFVTDVFVGRPNMNTDQHTNSSIGGKALSGTEIGRTGERAFRSLDSIAAENGFANPALLKIDTDGYDIEVLISGLDLIERSRPIVQIEAGRFLHLNHQTHFQIFTIAKSLGYKVGVLLPKSIRWESSPFRLGTQRYSYNLVLVPAENPLAQ